MNKTFHITTFGCQMNEHDSEIISGMLENIGYQSVEDRDKAKVVIINTCSVRENADKRFFGTLGQLKKRKEAEKDFFVCVCGCMMQQQHIVDTIKTKYPWVDIVFGTHNIDAFPSLLESTVTEKVKAIHVLEDSQYIPEELPSKRLHKHKALVNIMFGCNNFCTYCIVPYTRGREKSRNQEDIIKEVKRLVDDGVKEIMVLGQNVNSYKSPDGTTFPQLLWKLDAIEGLERIRFMTSHPKDLSDELIEVIRDSKKVCNNIHLPVQSGSDAVLKKMNRKYNSQHYKTLLDKIKKEVPEITISTDIIVGFPGETEEDFEDTLKMVEYAQYDSAFTFLYSIRKDTPAEKFQDQIPEDVKHRRFDRLVNLVNQIGAERNKACEGKVFQVLVDGPSKTDPAVLTGRTEGFKLVNFRGDSNLIGTMVNVKITAGKTFSLDGELV